MTQLKDKIAGLTEGELLELREEARKRAGSDSTDYRRYSNYLDRLKFPERNKAVMAAYRKTDKYREYNRARQKRLMREDGEVAEKVREHNRRYYKANRDKFKGYRAKRRQDPNFATKDRTARRISGWMKSVGFLAGKNPRKPRKDGGVLLLMGLCSTQQFKDYMEAQFKGDMNWGNYGSVWHLGHKIPCRDFDCSDRVQLMECFHYTNLQPEYPMENMKRRNEYPA